MARKKSIGIYDHMAVTAKIKFPVLVGENASRFWKKVTKLVLNNSYHFEIEKHHRPHLAALHVEDGATFESYAPSRFLTEIAMHVGKAKDLVTMTTHTGISHLAFLQYAVQEVGSEFPQCWLDVRVGEKDHVGYHITHVVDRLSSTYDAPVNFFDQFVHDVGPDIWKLFPVGAEIRIKKLAHIENIIIRLMR